MRTTLPALAALALAASPAAADARSPSSEQTEVMSAVEDFFAALRSEDKTALARHMVPEATIFVHNRMDPANPRIDVIPMADHLARWALGTRAVDERMHQETVLVDGDIAQVWGPYVFTLAGQVSHCGINSLSLLRGQDGSWRVGNTSFTMEPPERCAALGAPEAPQ